ncbi:MAG: hypothetical protein IJP30_05585 [Clostridia bacterium]|nr:hypothetical protein [Clostridia bacterium]
MRTEIVEVVTKRQEKEFVKFPVDMYRENLNYIPDLLNDELEAFRPEKNPALAFCRAKRFLAYQNGKVVGRIAGIVNMAANEKWGTKRIRYSRFDFIDDMDVSRALMDRVIEWGRLEGFEEIHGPMGFCDLDQEGMLIEGFDRPGMFYTIYNHPYYIEHMEALGFVKDVDWHEFRITIPDKPDPYMKRMSDIVLKRYKLSVQTPKNKKEIKEIVQTLFEIVNQAYDKLYGTVTLTPELIEKYYKQFILLVNPEYVRLVRDENNRAVGFGLALPSLNKAAVKSRGRLFPFGWARFLTAPKAKSDVLDLYLIGVVDEMRNKGVPAILINEIAETAIRNGVKYAESGPELETNDRVQSLWKRFESEQHKKRRCWIKKL